VVTEIPSLCSPVIVLAKKLLSHFCAGRQMMEQENKKNKNTCFNVGNGSL
jgi:hypothetical protein